MLVAPMSLPVYLYNDGHFSCEILTLWSRYLAVYRCVNVTYAPADMHLSFQSQWMGLILWYALSYCCVCPVWQVSNKHNCTQHNGWFLYLAVISALQLSACIFMPMLCDIIWSSRNSFHNFRYGLWFCVFSPSIIQNTWQILFKYTHIWSAGS